MKRYEEPTLLIDRFDLEDAIALDVYTGSAPDVDDTTNQDWDDFDLGNG